MKQLMIIRTKPCTKIAQQIICLPISIFPWSLKCKAALYIISFKLLCFKNCNFIVDSFTSLPNYVGFVKSTISSKTYTSCPININTFYEHPKVHYFIVQFAPLYNHCIIKESFN